MNSLNPQLVDDSDIDQFVQNGEQFNESASLSVIMRSISVVIANRQEALKQVSFTKEASG